MDDYLEGMSISEIESMIDAEECKEIDEYQQDERNY